MNIEPFLSSLFQITLQDSTHAPWTRKLALRFTPRALARTLNTSSAHENRHSISVSIFITRIFLGMTDIMKELCPAALRMDGAGYFRLLHGSSQKRKLRSRQRKLSRKPIPRTPAEGPQGEWATQRSTRGSGPQ